MQQVRCRYRYPTLTNNTFSGLRSSCVHLQNANGGPTYVFQRTTTEPSDSLEQGRGYPVKYTGMIKGGFRGSDDACVYSYSIPENAFTSVALRDISTVLTAVGQTGLASRALNMAAEIETGLQTYGTMEHPTAGKVWAYEVSSPCKQAVAPRIAVVGAAGTCGFNECSREYNGSAFVGVAVCQSTHQASVLMRPCCHTVCFIRPCLTVTPGMCHSQALHHTSHLATFISHVCCCLSTSITPVPTQVDGFGNAIFMDDANIPSLIGMPYYNFTSANDPLYLNTRRAALSAANPWFLNGTAGSGIGG